MRLHHLLMINWHHHGLLLSGYLWLSLHFLFSLLVAAVCVLVLGLCFCHFDLLALLDALYLQELLGVLSFVYDFWFIDID